LFIQKISKAIPELSNIMNKIDMCEVFHPMAANYTFFSAVHRNLFKIEHTLGHKANLKTAKTNRNNTLSPNRP
jgi:hypothetical protein